MMRTWFIALMLATCAFAGDGQFNGRWDITVHTPGGYRAWWLEVTGAGTPNLKGRFVGAPGGDMNDIPKITIEKNELQFIFDRSDTKRSRPWIGVYTAHLAAGKLEGKLAVNGGAPTLWTGVRAPKILDKDDGTWRESKPISLFDGKDLKGWTSLTGGEATGWTAKDGILSSTGHVKDLVTARKFWNFKLHLEYRVAPHSNSGIGLRGRYEAQILEDYGEPPNTHGSGAIYSRILPSENATKPANEWNTYDIRLVGRTVTVALNGKTVIDHKEIEGLTAIASDPNEALPGPIQLQGDHGPVDFRNIVLTPLVKKR